MASKGKQLTDEQKREIHVLYAEMDSVRKVAQALNISKSAVANILKQDVPKDNVGQLVDSYKKVREESNKKILELIESNSTANIVRRALDMFTDENLEHDVSKYGIGNMYRVVGMLTDKTLAIKEHEIKLKQLEIKQKQLELKEKELELRISNPEAFQEVHIINDAPEEEKEYASPS
jgi:IS30 family transposase